MSFSNECVYGTWEISGFRYDIEKEKHCETLSVSYFTDDTDFGMNFISLEVPLLSIWMKTLDYDMPNSEKSPEIFSELKNASSTLPLNNTDRNEELLLFLKNQTEESISSILDRVMSALDTAIEKRPALCFLMPRYYGILKLLKQLSVTDNPSSRDINDLSAKLADLSASLASLEGSYWDARKYCDAVFLTENLPNSELPTDIIANIYHSYCTIKSIPDFSLPKVHEIALNGKNISTAKMSWVNYLEYRKELYLSSNQKHQSYTFNDLSEFFRIGINLMLESQAVLRVCKLCGGYFRIKYSSSQEYCTRLYRETKTACNEYASRKSYKNKLFQHPIHQEFTKAYNKLYGRIRRGKLPADTPLMDELKRLHDEYYIKYENTHYRDREAIRLEYIEVLKELIK